MNKLFKSLLLCGTLIGGLVSAAELPIRSDVNVFQLGEIITEPLVADVGLFRINGGDLTNMKPNSVIWTARRMEGEYRSLGLNVRVTPYAFDADCTGRISGSCFDAAMTHTNRDHSHWHIWTGHSTGLCGEALSPGNRIWTAGTCSANVVNHEQGHGFGLAHSRIRGNDVINDSSNTFDGWSTWMGQTSGLFAKEFSFQQLKRFGTKLESAAGNGTWFLVSSYSATIPGQVHGVEIKGGYVISIWNNRVAISQQHGGTGILYNTLRHPGDSINFNGQRIHFKEKEMGVYKIVIDASISNQPFPAIKSKSYSNGLYSHSGATHQGVLVINKTIYWLTWDRQLRPQWFWGQDNILWSAERKRGNVQIKAVGNYQLTEQGMIYYTDTHGRGIFPMTKQIAEETQRIDEHWGFGDGRGLILQRQGNQIYGFLMDYAEGGTPLNPFRGQKWFLVSGNLNYEFNIYEPLLGYPNADLNPILNLIGTAKIKNKIWNSSLEESHTELFQIQ